MPISVGAMPHKFSEVHVQADWSDQKRSYEVIRSSSKVELGLRIFHGAFNFLTMKTAPQVQMLRCFTNITHVNIV